MSHLELILNPGIFSACFYKILVAISSVSRSKPFLKMSNTFSEPYLHFCDSSAYVHHASYEWHNLVQYTATFFTIIFIKWVSWDSNSSNGTQSVVVSQYISCGNWGFHNWPGAHSGRTRSAARPGGKCWIFYYLNQLLGRNINQFNCQKPSHS